MATKKKKPPKQKQGRVEMVSIRKIRPAEYNPRKDLKPEDAEYQKLKKSIDKFDCVETLVWNKRSGNLVGGHQRLKILIDRGDKEVLCSIVDLCLEDEMALNVALNKISGEWDGLKLADVFCHLDQMNYDLDLTGFDTPEIEYIVEGPTGEPEDQQIPEDMPNYLTFLVNEDQRAEIEKKLDEFQGENRTEQLLCLIRK